MFLVNCTVFILTESLEDWRKQLDANNEFSAVHLDIWNYVLLYTKSLH